MLEILNKIHEKGIHLPEEVRDLIEGAKSVRLYESVNDLALAAAGGREQSI